MNEVNGNIPSDNISKAPRVLLSGGGTGGHIFPAIAIAQEIKRRYPHAEILFIGARGKMEMEKVPQAGFKIEGLNISGFNRTNLLKNITLPFKIISSLLKAKKIIKEFKPDFAIGTGGFASGPALFLASRLGIPIFIQEQNSLPGKTNQFLASRARAVFTAYPDLDNYFKETKVFFLGNPIRQNIIERPKDTASAKEQLGLDPKKLTILSVGGSLGSRTLNNAWAQHLEDLQGENYQLIWQTGRQTVLLPDGVAVKPIDLVKQRLSKPEEKGILVREFISDMALAYAAADIIVSRAGAIAISELAVVGKPLLLVPLPFAAEDHQTKNAQSLVERNAAKMVKDVEMNEKFWHTLQIIGKDKSLREEMPQKLNLFAKPNATKDIVDKIEEMIIL